MTLLGCLSPQGKGSRQKKLNVIQVGTQATVFLALLDTLWSLRGLAGLAALIRNICELLLLQRRCWRLGTGCYLEVFFRAQKLETCPFSNPYI